MASLSYITIDGFTVQDLFTWTPKTPLVAMSEVRDYLGNDHVNLRWVKDAFRVSLPKLTTTQMSQLNQILLQTGVGALHTVIYGARTDSGTAFVRKWDGTTAYAAGYGVNDDVGRLRNRCKASPTAFPHWEGMSGWYSVSIDFEEA